MGGRGGNTRLFSVSIVVNSSFKKIRLFSNVAHFLDSEFEFKFDLLVWF